MSDPSEPSGPPDPPRADPPRGGDEPPESLTRWLRGRTDYELTTLLRRRPDLALPAPADIASLASRASVRTSVHRALDGVDAFGLRLLEATVLAAESGQPVHVGQLCTVLGPVQPLRVTDALTDLAELALLWVSHDQLHVVAGVRDAVGPYPTGLGRPAATLFAGVPEVQLATVRRALDLPEGDRRQSGRAVAAVLADGSRLAALIAGCDAAEHAVLSRLAAGPPIGTVRDARLPIAPDSPVAALRLLARGLLVRVDARTMELPREVGLALREHPAGVVEPDPPPLPVTTHPPDELDRAGGTAVLATLRLVETLASAWAADPPPQLRAGGLGLRELHHDAEALDVAEPVVALLIETAAAAGLLNATDDVPSVYLPTPEFDTWLRDPPAARWSRLASAWLTMTRQSSLIGQRGEQGRTIGALSPGVERATLPALRARLIDLLASLPPGAAPVSRDAVLARLRWQAPRRAATRAPLIEAALAEADLLGLTVCGGLTGYTRTLRDGSRAVAEQVLADALPEPVDHFVVQPDLTVIVPGPPTPGLARELAMVADLESSGGASVYRVTPDTVRRALDAGRTPSELHEFLTGRSRTPVPQALSYLIDDAARRYGALRAGVAAAYLRSDDIALLDRVSSDRTLEPLALRRLAPGVVISAVPVGQLLDALRVAGYAPAAEAPDGHVIALAQDARRAPPRPVGRPMRRRRAVDDQQLDELVRRIRAQDAAGARSTRVAPAPGQRPPEAAASSATATMELLRDAIRHSRQVLLELAGADGASGRHTIWPISMAAGVVRGHEPARGGLASFPLRRLTRVVVLDEDDGPGAP